MTTVDIVIPVYNEEHTLARSILKLRDFLARNLACHWTITIADNASTDNTLSIAEALSQEYSDVAFIHLDEKGRGRALRRSWLESSADIVSYMDVDLATDLGAFPRLVQAIEEGHDIAIGSRLLRDARIKRSLKRELLSRGYNFLIRVMFWASFHDAQCGFKAVRRDVAEELVPLIKDQAWFFDTELLLLAAKRKYRIKEVPVIWTEAAHTTVHIRETVVEDIKGLLRIRFRYR